MGGWGCSLSSLMNEVEGKVGGNFWHSVNHAPCQIKRGHGVFSFVVSSPWPRLFLLGVEWVGGVVIGTHGMDASNNLVSYVHCSCVHDVGWLGGLGWALSNFFVEILCVLIPTFSCAGARGMRRVRGFGRRRIPWYLGPPTLLYSSPARVAGRWMTMVSCAGARDLRGTGGLMRRRIPWLARAGPARCSLASRTRRDGPAYETGAGTAECLETHPGAGCRASSRGFKNEAEF